jgi:exocyst complex component 1
VASELHSTQMTTLLSRYSGSIKRVQEDDPENSSCLTFSFSDLLNSTRFFIYTSRWHPRASSFATRRYYDPNGWTQRKGERTRRGYGRAGGSIPLFFSRRCTSLIWDQVFDQALGQISRQIYREEEFIADFLQINEARLTFADYMGLDSYFRRQAARTIGFSPQTTKLVRGAMDLIFGFLPLEMKSWIDQILAKDSMYVFDASEVFDTHFILL